MALWWDVTRATESTRRTSKPALGPRLAALAAMVLPEAPALDVGTDHGLLAAALVAGGRVPRAIASDVRLSPLAGAAATIARLGLGDRVTVRRADGLRAIDPGEVATIVIAGMGGASIIRILEAEPERRTSAARLVLSPQDEAPRLRGWLVARGLVLVDEQLVEDRGRFYAVIAAERGPSRELSPLELEVGPRIVARGGPVLVRWLRRELALCDGAAAGLSRAAVADPERLLRVAERRARLAAALADLPPDGHPGPTS